VPTPPVAPTTRTIPELSIEFLGSLGDGLDSFSIKNSKNFIDKELLLVENLISWFEEIKTPIEN
jgi:hypothetical protein